MKEKSFPSINKKVCTGCGLCVQVCPVDCFLVEKGKTEFVGPSCIACCQCEAACPENAISLKMGAAVLSAFETFQEDERWSPYGEADTKEFIRFLRSRRSCRNFTNEPVKAETLRDLVRAGVYAPSATNQQSWSFTIIPDKSGIRAFVKHLVRIYEDINRLAQKKILRTILKWIGKPQLFNYYNEYFPFISRRIKEMSEGNRDVFFRGASAAIFVCGPKNFHVHDDAWLATQNILLAAHSMGLGTCLIGIANGAIRYEPSLAQLIGVPIDEVVYSVIAIGHPEISYEKLTKRFEPTMRMAEFS